MKKCLFFTSEKWGHLSVTTSIAKSLKEKHRIILCFNKHPKKETMVLLRNMDLEYIYNKCYFRDTYKANKEIIYKNTAIYYRELLLREEPDSILIDGEPFVLNIAYGLVKKIFRIKRISREHKLSSSMKKALNKFSNSFVKSSCIIVNLVPHTKKFLKVSGNSLYIKYPYLANKIEIKKEKSIDILIVFTTSRNTQKYFTKLLKVMTKSFGNKKVIVCYPFSNYDKVVYGNVTVYKWVNIDEYIGKCKVIISTGGHGICQIALLNRVPHIVINIKEIHCRIYGEILKKNNVGYYFNRIDSNLLAKKISLMIDNYQSYLENFDDLIKGNYSSEKMNTIIDNQEESKFE